MQWNLWNKSRCSAPATPHFKCLTASELVRVYWKMQLQQINLPRPVAKKIPRENPTGSIQRINSIIWVGSIWRPGTCSRVHVFMPQSAQAQASSCTWRSEDNLKGHPTDTIHLFWFLKLAWNSPGRLGYLARNCEGTARLHHPDLGL